MVGFFGSAFTASFFSNHEKLRGKIGVAVPLMEFRALICFPVYGIQALPAPCVNYLVQSDSPFGLDGLQRPTLLRTLLGGASILLDQAACVFSCRRSHA